MSNLIKIDDAQTQNGAVTNSSTSNPVVDLYFQINAMRNRDENDVINLFAPAFESNPRDALKILFYSRDIRGGQGERKTFRTIIKWLAVNHSNLLRKNLELISEYGRWDDLFELVDTPLENDAFSVLKQALDANNGLAAKWTPRSKSARHDVAEKFRSFLKLTPRQYRKMLSSKTKVVEQDMCSNHWDDINYSHVPSLAMRNYRNAFERHSSERWAEFLSAVEKGETKVNASALYPHDIVKPILNTVKAKWENRQYVYHCSLGESELRLLEQQWAALPNFMEHNRERILPIVDTSGSMTSGATIRPIDVAVALGLYIAEKNDSIFRNAFITFSTEPELQIIPDGKLVDKVSNIRNAKWAGSTDIAAVFKLILDKAKQAKISPNEMPSMILILSDMEFNSCGGQSNYQFMRDAYEAAQYPMPKIVFWNLNALSKNFPVSFDEQGTALISGFSPVILKQLLTNGSFDPVSIMRRTIDVERYEKISV